MRTRLAAAIATALLAVAVLAGCGGTQTDHLAVEDGPLAGGNAITPAVLKVHKGHKVEIKVTNTATDKAHGFSIDGYSVAKTVDTGKTDTISFTANKSGSSRVFCQLHPTHQAAQLVVS